MNMTFYSGFLDDFFSSLDLRTSPCITVTNKHISNDVSVYLSWFGCWRLVLSQSCAVFAILKAF